MLYKYFCEDQFKDIYDKSYISHNHLSLKVDQEHRPSISYILKLLSSIAKSVSENSGIEVQWKKFHSEINVSTEVDVDESTQASRDLFKEITDISLKAKPIVMATGGTNLYHMKDTNLCAYFATMSALRHQLRKCVGDKKTSTDIHMLVSNILSGTDKHKKEELTKELGLAGLPIEDYIEKLEKKFQIFERCLAVLIACVSPRALSLRFRKNI